MAQTELSFTPNDPTVRKAIEICIKKKKFSTAFLQTYLGRGHNYVTNLGVWLANMGVIALPDDSNKPGEVLISSLEEFDQKANNKQTHTKSESQSSKKGEAQNNTKGKARSNAKGGAIILLILLVLVVVYIISPDGLRKHIDSKNDTSSTQCSSEKDCKKLLEYGDENVLNLLKSIGIEKIESISDKYDGGTKVDVKASGEENWKARLLVIEYNGNEISRIRASSYSGIIYYSKDGSEKTFTYPALDEMARQDADFKEKIDEALEEDNIEITLMTLTQQNVKNNLKAPKTAKFSDWKYGTKKEYPGVRFLSGVVTSQNSFGAMLPDNFVAGYRDSGDGNWTLVYLLISDTTIVNNL